MSSSGFRKNFERPPPRYTADPGRGKGASFGQESTGYLVVQRTRFNIIDITRQRPFGKLLFCIGFLNLWITMFIY